MTKAKIKKMIILGGGSAGWMTAAALAKTFNKQQYQIQLIESDEIGTVGVGEATIPPVQLFNKLIGLDENEFMKQTQATFKLGIKFVNWDQIGHEYHHAFGDLGKDIGGLRFYQYWLKMRSLGQAKKFEEYSLNAVASEEKRFMRSIDAGNSPLSNIAYAFHFDATLYAKYLRTLSEQCGVLRTEGKVAKVQQHANGFIKSLILEDGSEHTADFFIDCSGFSALLIGKTLNTPFEDWSHWLPCDRAVAVASESTQTPWSFTQATAHAAGWQWRIPLQHRVGNGHVYSSQFMSDEEAKKILLDNIEGKPLAEPRLIKFKTGHRRQCWNKNCLAIGLSSGFLEPLESTSLHLIQLAIEQLFKFFPHADFDQVDIDEYNRQATFDFERIRDFLILHYKVTQRDDSDFWNYCRTMSVPETVQQKIDLFRNNGRIFRINNEMFDYQSWFQVMNGQGLTPRAYEPLVDMLSEKELAKTMHNIHAVIRKSADYMPAHQDYINANCKA
ncbi:MAG: tryptophan 7-halogenase [Paraglaciecola sp.]|nr:tryptophan halogenase family protein [Paraglaciecola sp.]MDP5029099.1 tryptophan 7-halogenase [Paraglaciecola sp.]